MLINDGEWALAIINKMIHCFDNVLLDLLAIVAVIVWGVEVKGVGNKLLTEFEKVELFNVRVVTIKYFFHSLVEGRIITGH